MTRAPSDACAEKRLGTGTCNRPAWAAAAHRFIDYGDRRPHRLVDYLRGAENPETRWLDRELQRQRLGLTDRTLCEALQGVGERRNFDRVPEDLLRFALFPSGSVELAIAAADNHRELRQRAITVRTTIDCLIATLCLLEGHALLHRERDFRRFRKVPWPARGPRPSRERRGAS